MSLFDARCGVGTVSVEEWARRNLKGGTESMGT
jgi:hypothetical protein